MISSRTSKGLDPHTATPTAATTQHPTFSQATRLLHHPSRHLRGLLRLARRRQALAFALGAASLSGLATVAATVATVQHLHAAAVLPLAPAPAPMNAAAATSATRPTAKHHFFSSLVSRTLAARSLAAGNLTASNALHGLASWYGSVLHGHKTASGETFDEAELTACHRTLPFGTLVRVTDTASLRSVIVRINDRGVLNPDRVIDLSAAAADKLGILRSGLARVRLEVLQSRPAPKPEPTESN